MCIQTDGESMKHSWSHYLKKEIWCINLHTLTKWHALRIRFWRIVALIGQGFAKSQIQQGASTLTYYTLLGIVPFLAILISIARGFNLELLLQTWLLTEFPQQREVINTILTFTVESLSNVHQGVLATFGLLILFISGIEILLYMELVFNTIWEQTEGRSFARRFTDYLAMFFLCPVLIFLASSLTVYLPPTLHSLSYQQTWSHLAPLILSLFNLAHMIITCFLFTFLYIFIPNTQVRFFPALWAGILSGFMYQFTQWIYLYFQIAVTSYSTIYGTLIALPLFLIWINLSWMILLLGAKMAFAFQNVDAFDLLSEELQLSDRCRLLLSIRIAHFCIQRFEQSLPPPSAVEVSNQLSIPLSTSKQLLESLVEASLLIQVKIHHHQDEAFQPACSTDHLTIKSVIDKMSTRGREISLPSSREIARIENSLKLFDLAIERSEGNLLIKDL